MKATQALRHQGNMATHINTKIGDTYESWTVIGEPVSEVHSPIVHRKRHKQKLWFIPVRCSCGRERKVLWNNLRRGLSRQCTVCGSHGGRKPAKFLAFGEEKTLKEWELDPRCNTKSETIRARIGSGYSIEESIKGPKNKMPSRQRKLTVPEIVEVFHKANSGISGCSLAIEYGVSRTTISHIKTGKIYADISGYNELMEE